MRMLGSVLAAASVSTQGTSPQAAGWIKSSDFGLNLRHLPLEIRRALGDFDAPCEQEMHNDREQARLAQSKERFTRTVSRRTLRETRPGQRPIKVLLGEMELPAS
jgi:hypothetical protein